MVATIAPPRQNKNIVGDSASHSDSSSDVSNCRKRSRLDLGENQTPHLLGAGAVKDGGVVQTVEIGTVHALPHASYSAATRRQLHDDIIEPAAKQTSLCMPRTVAPLIEHRRSEELIKTEMELAVLF